MNNYIKWFVGPTFRKREFIKLLRYKMNVRSAEAEDGIILDLDAFNAMRVAYMPHWAYINRKFINSNLHTRIASEDEYKVAMIGDTIGTEWVKEQEAKKWK